MMLSIATANSSKFLGIADGDWATIAPAIVAVVVAVAAWIQARRATSQSSYGATASLLQDMNRIFIENPKLRPVFFENVNKNTLEEPDDQQKVEAVTSYLLNVYEAAWSFTSPMGKDEKKAWRNYIHDELKEGSILRIRYDANKEFYPNLTKALKYTRR